MIVNRREALTGRILLVLLMAITVVPFVSLFVTALHPSGTYPSGLSWPDHPQWANFAALLISAIANTAANRRFTFGVLGRARLATHHLAGLAVFALGWALTSGSLAGLHALTTPERWLELAVVTAANLAATALKFLLFRQWLFRRRA